MERREQTRFKAEMAELYADAKCEICGKRPICWNACCFPPRGYGEINRGYCHACRKMFAPRVEELTPVCPTCGGKWKNKPVGSDY